MSGRGTPYQALNITSPRPPLAPLSHSTPSPSNVGGGDPGSTGHVSGGGGGGTGGGGYSQHLYKNTQQ